MAKTGFLGAIASAALRGAGTLLRPTRSRVSRPAQAPVPGASDGRLDAFVYAPHGDGTADPGEVVWAWIPYEDDPSQGKDRPSIAIGYDGPLLVVVPLTSKDQGSRPDTLGIGSGPWDREGRPSWVKLDRLIGVRPAAVRREGATLDRARFDQVVSRLKAIHGANPRLSA
jgi:hypothetical protein